MQPLLNFPQLVQKVAIWGCFIQVHILIPVTPMLSLHALLLLLWVQCRDTPCLLSREIWELEGICRDDAITWVPVFGSFSANAVALVNNKSSHGRELLALGPEHLCDIYPRSGVHVMAVGRLCPTCFQVEGSLGEKQYRYRICLFVGHLEFN